MKQSNKQKKPTTTKTCILPGKLQNAGDDIGIFQYVEINRILKKVRRLLS